MRSWSTQDQPATVNEVRTVGRYGNRPSSPERANKIWAIIRIPFTPGYYCKQTPNRIERWHRISVSTFIIPIILTTILLTFLYRFCHYCSEFAPLLLSTITTNETEDTIAYLLPQALGPAVVFLLRRTILIAFHWHQTPTILNYFELKNLPTFHAQFLSADGVVDRQKSQLRIRLWWCRSNHRPLADGTVHSATYRIIFNIF